MSREVKKEGRKRISILFPSVSITENKGSSEKKLRVGAYCRVSSNSEEQLLSYNAQLEHYREYLTNHKEYVFAGIYTDEGVSGTGIKKREGFLRMLEDCRNGNLDMIITKSVSRLGRNTVDCLKVVRELRELGIDIFFEKENIHSLRSEGEMILTLMMAVAEAESYNLSDNIRWGKQRKYEQGSNKSVGGMAPYGYIRTENGFVIDEGKAEIIRRIYSIYLDGYGPRQIARKLNEENISAPIAGSWDTKCITNILKNEKHKGDICYRKTYIMDPLTKKCVVNNGEQDRYYIKNAHEGIIDEELWECVQLEEKRRKEYGQAHHVRFSNNKGDLYPFAGKLICAECGYSYLLKNTNRVEDNGKPRWSCGSFYKLRGKADRSAFDCHQMWIEANKPEKAFINAWNQIVSHRARYTADFERLVVESDDILIRYRAQEMIKLLSETGEITQFDSKLLLKILDHIEVTSGEKFTVVFLNGIKIAVKQI